MPRTNIGTSLWPVDRAERARYEPMARAQLGDAAYTAAHAAGPQLALDEAVAEALGWYKVTLFPCT
jgi:hypothetical protein